MELVLVRSTVERDVKRGVTHVYTVHTTQLGGLVGVPKPKGPFAARVIERTLVHKHVCRLNGFEVELRLNFGQRVTWHFGVYVSELHPVCSRRPYIGGRSDPSV
jgi:hypothetical protein